MADQPTPRMTATTESTDPTMPACCVCPADHADAEHEACLEAACSFCLHGCPAIDPTLCCRDWTGANDG